MANEKLIEVDSSWYSKSAEEKTAHANEVAKSFGIPDSALVEVEAYKAELSKHDAWDLPFLGYVNEDGYGFAYVPDAAKATDGWDAHAAFKNLSEDGKTAFAIRMLFTHRDVGRAGAEMFLRMNRNFTIRREGAASAKYA